MRGVWRRLGPRYGVGLGLVVAIAAIVLIARIGTHPTPSGLATGSGVATTGTPTGEPDDGDPAIPARRPPTASAGGPTASAVALSFTNAWIRHDGTTAQAWRTAVTKYTTGDLAAQFADVDPGSVPANRVTGLASITPHDAFFVEVSEPTDEGILVLGIRFSDGRWLVDSVDWDPS